MKNPWPIAIISNTVLSLVCFFSHRVDLAFYTLILAVLAIVLDKIHHIEQHLKEVE